MPTTGPHAPIPDALAVFALALIFSTHPSSADEPTTPPAADDTQIFEVTQPTFIAYFPGDTVEDTERNSGWASALDHFGYAYLLTQKCLAGSAVSAQVYRGSTLRVRINNELKEIDLSTASVDSIGCFLATPGKAPLVVRAYPPGPSSLVVRCPGAAASYFSMPACCPKGWRCCSNGDLVDEASTCEP